MRVDDRMDNPAISMRHVAMCTLAALVLLLMLPNLVWLWFTHDIAVWAEAVIVPAVLLLVLFALLGNRLWIACMLAAPFAMLAPLETFFIAYYQHPTSAEIIATLMATNIREMREYLGNSLLPLLLCVIAGLLLSLFTAWSCRLAHLRWHYRSRMWVLFVAFAVPLTTCLMSGITTTGDFAARTLAGIQVATSLLDPIERGYPFGLFQRVFEYRREWATMRRDVAQLDGFRFHAHRIPGVAQRQLYLLVIGESSSRNHWQIFGYNRATNPELIQVRNIVPISDMDSSWPESIAAIPMIVTRKPAAYISPVWREASILRAMQEAGYETYWISNQLPIGKFDSPVSTYAYEAQHDVFINHASWSAPGSYDEDLLQPLRDALRDSNHDLFIVIHLMGSHASYDFRYPVAYRRFRPTLSDPEGDGSHSGRARNSYDNSILYTDHVLASIISVVRDSNAVAAVWYESDHGEAVPTPTCSVEWHGNGTRFEYEISALAWYSDSYASTFPTRVSALRINAGNRTMSADTFESLIDMAGVGYPEQDPSLSLFSLQWRYRPRTVNVPWQVDIDQAVFSKDCKIAMPPRA